MKSNLKLLIILLIPQIWIYKTMFYGNTGVSGDAPYFFQKGLIEFLDKIHVWNEWGGVLGNVNKTLWLYPINYLYGFIGGYLGIGNDIAIKLVFYFPAIMLSLVSSICFARFLNAGKISVFITALLYSLNTYFLLLVDGGQVGVLLSYGLFPLTLLYLRKLLDKLTVNLFFSVLIIFNLQLLTDIRFGIIVLLTIIVWEIFQIVLDRNFSRKNYFALTLILLTSLLINSFWLAPLLLLDGVAVANGISGLQLTTLLHSLTLFQPHWPNNEFGKVNFPPYYFIGLPAIWIIGQIFYPSRKYLPIILTLLVFVFLTKGTTPPLGEGYQLILDKIPFGSIFRDSTKFFAPVILFTAVLIGFFVQKLSDNKNELISRVLPIIIGIYLLFLVHPAIFGHLNGSLSATPLDKSYQIIADKITADTGIYRTVWFNSKPPFAYHTNENPAIDARYLTDFKPVAGLNVGSYDRFNFLTTSLSDEWLEMFNAKYLFFDPNEEQLKDVKLKEEWDILIKRVDENRELKKLDWGLGFPGYELMNTKPRVFEKEKAYLVIGSQNIYDKLLGLNPNYDVSDNLFYFAEDGLTNPNNFTELNPNHISIVFNDKKQIDLQMSFLQGDFNNLPKPLSEWAFRDSGDYLRWKYEFLINGVDTKDYDYNRGIYFSTIKEEKLVYTFDQLSGDYVLAVRLLDGMDTKPLKLDFNNKLLEYQNENKNMFVWQTFPVKLDRTAKLLIENTGGFHSINIVALIPKKNWDKSVEITNNYLKNYQTINLQSLAKNTIPLQTVKFTAHEPSQVLINDIKPGWIVFSSNYDNDWVAYENKNIISKSYSAYSSLNSFYVPQQTTVLLKHNGQKYLESGIYISFATLLLLTISYFILKWKAIWYRARRKI